MNICKAFIWSLVYHVVILMCFGVHVRLFMTADTDSILSPCNKTFLVAAGFCHKIDRKNKFLEAVVLSYALLF
jgi:hypothetical protein